MPTVNCHWITELDWHEISGETFILKDCVDVCYIRISSLIQKIGKLSEFLQEDERTRAFRYHHEKDRIRFQISRGALKLILSKYLQILPASLQLFIGKNKKPFVHVPSGLPLQYNITHSEDCILVAISNAQVGIDVEKIDSQFVYSDILPSNFSREESKFVQEGANPRENFYLLWTRKESMVKASGKGMDENFMNVPSLTGIHQIEELTIGSGEDWSIGSFRINHQYLGAVAHPIYIRNLRFWNADSIIQTT